MAVSIIEKEFVCVQISKNVTRNANAPSSRETVTYNRPSGYKVVSVTTAMESSEYMHPLLIYIHEIEGMLVYMIDNTYGDSLSRNLIVKILLQKS